MLKIYRDSLVTREESSQLTWTRKSKIQNLERIPYRLMMLNFIIDKVDLMIPSFFSGEQSAILLAITSYLSKHHHIHTLSHTASS